MTPSALPVRMEHHIEQITESGCWIWTPSTSYEGYAMAYWNGTTWPAHRAVYTILVGPIPDGQVIDHLCRVRCCVNPYHLEAITHAENLRRGHAARRLLKSAHTPRWKFR